MPVEANLDSERGWKVVVLGSYGSGKSTYLNRMTTGWFDQRYRATQGWTRLTKVFNTNYGLIEFDLIDTAGQQALAGDITEHLNTAYGAIVMYDSTSRQSIQDADHYYHLAVQHGIEHIVVVANKIDIVQRTFSPYIVKYRDPIFVSARTNYHFDKPFLALAKKCWDREDVVFTEMPRDHILTPPTIELYGVPE